MATHVRIVRGDLQDGKTDEAMSLLQGQILPQIVDIDGYEGCDFSVDGNRFELRLKWAAPCPIGVQALEELYAELVQAAAPVITGSTTFERHEVMLEIGAPPPSPAT